VQEARRSVDDRRAAFQKDWTRLRLPEEHEPLLHKTSVWLAELPRAARTLVLAQRFPRIANKLASLWPTPVQCERYMGDLLLVRRGDVIRRGFSPQIVRELAALSSFYSLLHPPQAEVIQRTHK
jgi:hypothetical protein